MIPTGIINPPASWWPGDPRVEKYMPSVSKAIIESGIKRGSKEYTNIYNRAYEAVYQAIVDGEAPHE